MIESIENRTERERKMKLIVQRVSQASVAVDGQCVGAVGAGYLVLVGCRFDDTPRDAEHLAAKLAALRVFETRRAR